MTITTAAGGDYAKGDPGEQTLDIAALQQQALINRKKIEWAAWVDTKYQECRNARVSFERQWYINMAFYSGRHYIAPMDIPGTGFRLSPLKAPPWRVRAVVNKIRTALLIEHSKLSSSRPIPTVVPSTTEDEDYSAAVVAEQILKTAFADEQYLGQFDSWVGWGTICGNAFIKQYWDPNCPDTENMMQAPWPTFPNGQPIPDSIVQQHPRLKQEAEQLIPARGKIVRETVNPFYIYCPDLLAEDIENQPYVIHASTRSPLWVERTYGFKANCDARASNTLLDTAMIIARGGDDHMDSVMVKEIWIKQDTHPDFPQGGMLVVINQRVVYMRDSWPLPFREYPFYKFDAMFSGGFYNDSRAVDLIPLNKEYNKTRSQGIEIKNIMGKPRFFYQQGSLNPRKVSSEAGQMVPYTAGYQPPILMPAVDIPMSYNTELDRINNDFYETSGQLDYANNNQDITSGTALAFLQEQDELKIANQIKSIEKATQRMGRHYLLLASTYWTDDRIIKTTGRNQGYEALRWKRNMLRGNTDVRVQTGSALPVNKAARQALITEFMQNGFLSPETGLEILDMGSLDKALEEYLIDKKQAMRENLRMQDTPDEVLQQIMMPHPGPNGEEPFELPDPATGEPVQFNGDQTPFQPQPSIKANSYDNHEAHIQWHNTYRKSQEFENLSDEKKQDFELHVQSHQFAISQNQINVQGQIVQPGMMPEGIDPAMGQGGLSQGAPQPQDTSPTPPYGGAVGKDDPNFGENAANQKSAVDRKTTVQAREGKGRFKN